MFVGIGVGGSAAAAEAILLLERVAVRTLDTSAAFLFLGWEEMVKVVRGV